MRLFAGARMMAAGLVALVGAAVASAHAVETDGIWTRDAAATSEVRALVIGIDAYTRINPLRGEVNDAYDLLAALRNAGAKDVTVLLDGQADRDTVLNEWDALVERSRAGDILFFTYAGHGAQEPERRAGSEADGKDEVLVLPDFAPEGPGALQRIIDDELNARFKIAEEKGLRIVFINDSCHSGGATRSLRPVSDVSYRLVENYSVSEDMNFELDLSLGDPPEADEGELGNLIFLGGGQEHQLIPEVRLPGRDGEMEYRGALSYTMARALEGDADFNDNGILDWTELQRYVRENVRTYSENRQQPNLIPSDGVERALISLADGPGTAVAESVRLPQLTVRAVNAGPADLQTLESLQGARVVRDENTFADLIWDGGRGEIVSSAGDMLAEVPVEGAQRVVDKWRALTFFRARSGSDPMAIRVGPDDSLHREGERITISLDGIGYPHIALFSLAGDGSVQLLFPDPNYNDPPTVEVASTLAFDVEVGPPFGADHLIALTSDRPLDFLIAPLRDARSPIEIAERLNNAMRGDARFRVGVQGIYTGR